MTRPPLIAESLYRNIVRVLPIACVDIILRAPDGKFVLVRRKDEPLKGEWWVVGGRLSHGETAVAGASRKVREELGVDTSGLSFAFRGYYEDRFERSALGEGLYHTVSLVFESALSSLPQVVLDSHSDGLCLAERLPERLAVIPSSPLPT